MEHCLSNDISDWLSGFRELNPVVDEEQEVDSKAYKNDMFKEVLPALDRRDKNFYNTRNEEQKKELEKSMWMVMRLMSSSKSHPEHHIMMVNDLVNVDFNVFVKKATMGKEGHPNLQWKLLALCGSGKNQFHEMVKPPKGMQKSKIEEAILNFYPSIRDDELELLLKINSKEELSQFFKDNGYDDKAIKDLFGKDGTKSRM